ncbi:hypothetical protein SDC9_68432 [bioreactor metagenome]|uniref:Uncharacterized protein n=1 Tax=bioreactor metagenome TaxID=1076179 RepID=A0A644Y0E4_9ZZZZ
MSQSDIAVRAFDQPRDVRHRQPAEIGIFHHPDHRMQRGEGVRRHLGPRRRNRPQQRRLAGVGIADQPGVGDGFQFEFEPEFLAFAALFGLARSPVAAGGKTGVAAPALAAMRHHHFHAGGFHIRHQLAGVGIDHYGPDRHLDQNVGSLAPVHVLAFAVGSMLRGVMAVVAQIDQALLIDFGLKDHIATGAAVAAVGTAARHEFFPAETDAAVAAVSALDQNLRSIDKHFKTSTIKKGRNSYSESGPGNLVARFRPPGRNPRCGRQGSAYASAAAGTTLTVRADLRNSTTPSQSAKSVKSRPQPTFLPG